MKKILSLSAILATVVLLGAGCNINGQTTPTTSDNTSTTPTGETVVTETDVTQPADNNIDTNTTNQLTYTNSEFHFSLSLPATWEGYTTKTTENAEGGKTVWFGFTGWDDILAISIYPTEVNPHSNMRYFGTDNQVYYYGSSAQYIKVPSLEARWKENKQIMDTFSVANLNAPGNPINYINPEFHFTLQLPGTWQGYTTKTTENAQGGKTVWFGFENWDDILAISIYPTKMEDHPNMRYYGTDGEVYYYGAQAQSIKINDLEARWKDANQILSSFDVAHLDQETDQ